MKRPPIPIPKELKKVADIYADAGKQCWLVGGALRDGLMGRKSEDFDIATDAEPEETVKLFHRTIPTGIKHGTVTILMGSHQFETTTFRTDGKYSDGRRPDEVNYTDDIREDLARRDFTINAMAWNLIDGGLLDPHGGKADLSSRIIRAIGVPDERFKEDSLRLIRACRFAAQLNFSIQKETLDAMLRTLDGIPSLSVERIWEEMKKIFASPRPSKAFSLFHRTRILPLILPELEICAGVEQKGRHLLDVFDHCLIACDVAPIGNLAVRTAALFHDIGKPLVKSVDDKDEVIFHKHDEASAEAAENILRRYKTPNAFRERVVRLVRHHMFQYTSEWTDAAVRRFMSRAGLDILDDLLALRLADAAAVAPGQKASTAHLAELVSRVDGILEAESALTIGDLAVNGNDLIRELNLKPGPLLGTLLDYLLDCVIEDPSVNKKEKLLDMARRRLEIHV